MAPQDAETPHRPRNRASTTSFLNWRRRPEPTLSSAAVTGPHAPEIKSLREIVSALTPPGVLSLATARQLVEALKAANKPGSTHGFADVLSSLCSSEMPALRAVGFEAMLAYLENPSTPPVSDHDRFILFSLFPTPSPQGWIYDVWEKAQPAMQALTKDGAEVVGIESLLLRLLRAWIEGAVYGLLSQDNVATNDRSQRESSVVSICRFLTRIMSQARTMARLPEADMTDVLEYLGGLVDRSMRIPLEAFGSPPLPAEAPLTPTRLIHRRHYSSTSITQITHSTLRRPSDITVSVYLDHLSSQMRFLSPSHLKVMLPVLFRALAQYSSSLPRLSLTKNGEFDTEHELERRIVETLDPLLNGAYSSTCFVITKRHTLPDGALDAHLAVQTSMGACRALRIYWRRALCARLARALIARSSVDSYTPSGAPSAMDFDTSLMERAWTKDEVTRGELNRVGRLFRRASEAWIALAPDAFAAGDFNEREDVLLEIAGAVRDVFQEYDLRGELEDVDEEERGVIGSILGSLTEFVHPLKSSLDGTPYILPLSHYADASSNFLRGLSALLARDHSVTPTVPPLTSILLSVSDHLSDATSAKVVDTMFKRGDLSPISMDWITHWAVLANKPELSRAARPLTRAAVLDALQAVFASVHDVPVHRHPFVDTILAACRAHAGERDQDGLEVVWHVLADEMIMRMSEAQELVWQEAEDAKAEAAVPAPEVDAEPQREPELAPGVQPEAEPESAAAEPEPDARAVVDGAPAEDVEEHTEVAEEGAGDEQEDEELVVEAMEELIQESEAIDQDEPAVEEAAQVEGEADADAEAEVDAKAEAAEAGADEVGEAEQEQEVQALDDGDASEAEQVPHDHDVEETERAPEEEDAQADGAQAEEAPADDAPADDAQADEAQADKTQAVDAQTEETPAEQEQGDDVQEESVQEEVEANGEEGAPVEEAAGDVEPMDFDMVEDAEVQELEEQPPKADAEPVEQDADVSAVEDAVDATLQPELEEDTPAVQLDNVVFEQPEPLPDASVPLTPRQVSTAAARDFVDSVLNFLETIAIADEGDEPDLVSATSPSAIPTPGPFSRSYSEFPSPVKEKEAGLMSLLSSFASGANARTHSTQTPRSDDTISIAETITAPETIMPASVGAVVTLIHIFSQLAFTPYALSEQSRLVAIRIYKSFVKMLREAKSSRVRLTVLQFFFRLRVDRDHRLFSVYDRYDRLGHIGSLASTIGRAEPAPGTVVPEASTSPHEEEVSVVAVTRARAFQRDGRRASRGRDRPERSASSRSRSRVASRIRSPTEAVPGLSELPTTRKPLWRVPEALPFKIPESDTPSDGIMSYNADAPNDGPFLPTSSMLYAFNDILHSEKDWDILSYVLCHLPTLLANKHLFCGPKSKFAMTVLLETICAGIASGELGKHITHWPLGLRSRDAQGLAFHTLSVLISYRDCFSAQQRHILVEMLISGLSAQQSTVKACIQALSIAAFELATSIKRFLPDILTKLSQIMTNASIATHIIDFLAIVGSLPALYANFIERDFKMVFGVALQYLRLHNRPDSPESTSVLSQHVRLMSFSILYTWFLAVKLSDRPRHVKYITRQLLLANEGRDEVDEPTEVCFDWLARYTYSSGDPRPASSMLGEIIMKPSVDVPQSDVVAEKAWIVGNAVVSVRALSKLGWLEVSARRPSGLTRFLARVENVPMVGPGEVDPDTISVAALLTMDREPDGEDNALYQAVMSTIFPPVVADADDEEPPPPHPDPITGYVWQGTAPSQRRKEVAIDPAFFALQLSAYPGQRQNTRIEDISALPTFLRTFDRMPVIDTHKVGILYVAPGQSTEIEILGNVHGSPAYTHFLEGLGRLANLRGQKDVYAGGLDPDEDGEYHYAFWDDIGQVLYHTATLMPNHDYDPQFNTKKRHIGNDCVRIVWNDSGAPYRFDTLSTQFQFCNIVIESHSLGAIAAFSDNQHHREYFRVTVQCAPGMQEFAPLGAFKLISAQNLPLLVRQLSLLADWYSSVYQYVSGAPGMEMETNWRSRLRALKRFRAKQLDAQRRVESESEPVEGILAQEVTRDFTSLY